jgi:hypothetical protein
MFWHCALSESTICKTLLSVIEEAKSPRLCRSATALEPNRVVLVVLKCPRARGHTCTGAPTRLSQRPHFMI